MAGLLQSGNDKTLTIDQVEESVLGKLDPKMAKAAQKVAFAGMKFIFDPRTRDQAIKKIEGDDKPEDVGRGVSYLVVMLHTQVKKGSIPPEAAMSGGCIICAHALDFCGKAGMGVVLDKDTYARTVKSFVASMLQRAGVTPEKINAAVENIAAKQGVK